MDEVKKPKTYVNRIDPHLYGKPVDYSFRKVVFLSELEHEPPREFRVGLPKKDNSGKFVSRSLWINYNRLASLQHLHNLVSIAFHKVQDIYWLDVSFNDLKFIPDELTLLQNLKILYLHGNGIKYFIEVVKLRPLFFLRKLTLHGNPLEEHPNYRLMVTKTLPQLTNFDFSQVTKI